MPRLDVLNECQVYDSFRVQQVAGMFDVPIAKRASQKISGEVPDASEPWQVGVIVGPSGSGKSTIARKAFGDSLYCGSQWKPDCAVVDCFDASASIRDISHILTAVGFSSPPSWLKPYTVLSNGEKFRCDLARALLAPGSVVAFDEFTSVVDRTVAKIGSAAVSKAIRSGKVDKQFVAVACHYDIVEWLEPDWVLDMASASLTRGRLRRPEIAVDIVRCKADAWELFKPHHYLSAAHNKAAVCFLATIEGQPAAFASWLPYVGRLKTKQKGYRLHRAVVLPDFQGVGLGGKLTDWGASVWAGVGYRVFVSMSHPALIRSRQASPVWRLTRAPSRTQRDDSGKATKDPVKTARLAASRAFNRITASFEYSGPAMSESDARRVLHS